MQLAVNITLSPPEAPKKAAIFSRAEYTAEAASTDKSCPPLPGLAEYLKSARLTADITLSGFLPLVAALSKFIIFSLLSGGFIAKSSKIVSEGASRAPSNYKSRISSTFTEAPFNTLSTFFISAPVTIP